LVAVNEKEENQMSDTSQGPGWYQASDGKWYPPAPPAAAPTSKPIYKRVWFWILIAVIVLFGGCGIAVIGSVGVVSKSISDASNKVHTITYSVTGDGPADITYDTFTNGNAGSEQANGASLPWTKTLTAKGIFSVYSLGAQITSGSTVSCSITLDGKVISSHTSTGQYANVECSGSN
jgi:Mycobacterium membrane protein